MNDPVNHPLHYTSHPSGVECITVTEHMSFNVGNAVKYLWRADEKGAAIEDLRKAAWYVTREIQRRETSEQAARAAQPARTSAQTCETAGSATEDTPGAQIGAECDHLNANRCRTCRPELFGRADA